jgi:hypothetical protein
VRVCRQRRFGGNVFTMLPYAVYAESRFRKQINKFGDFKGS